MYLIEALRYKPNSVIAFVGAGGKTTALFKAASEFSTLYQPDNSKKTVLVTTSTHLGVWQTGEADHIIRINSQFDLNKLEMNLPKGIILLVGEDINDRIRGLSARMLEYTRGLAEKHDLPLLIEADGSACRPLKAPAKHEPAIPDFSQIVVVVAGLNGLGKALSGNWVHRPEIFAELSGMRSGEAITAEALVNVLKHRDGGLKNIPPSAHKVLLLNQADNLQLKSRGREISEPLQSVYHSTIIASLGKGNLDKRGVSTIGKYGGEIFAVIEKIAAIILAAGGSSRFGMPKQLLLWRGQAFIRHVTFTCKKAGLDPVVVVLGSSAREIAEIISDTHVRIVINRNWKDGISSSIRMGLNALTEQVGGAVFLQADQPQVSQDLIQKLVAVHQKTLSPITVPKIIGQRGNPVLFDQNLFPELLKLKGDIGGRVLFSRFPIKWVNWQNRNIFHDIDTPEDYQKLLKMFPDRENSD